MNCSVIIWLPVAGIGVDGVKAPRYQQPFEDLSVPGFPGQRPLDQIDIGGKGEMVAGRPEFRNF